MTWLLFLSPMTIGESTLDGRDERRESKSTQGVECGS